MSIPPNCSKAQAAKSAELIKKNKQAAKEQLLRIQLMLSKRVS
jgi:hypothetical protein